MEYLIGSLITFGVMVTASLLSRKYNPQAPIIRYSQSHIHRLIYPFLPSNHEMQEHKESQSSKHMDEIFTRIVFVDNEAYWIKDGKFFVADVVDGDVVKETATEVDTMAMDAIQLNKIKIIVEKLSEGKDNDSRNAG